MQLLARRAPGPESSAASAGRCPRRPERVGEHGSRNASASQKVCPSYPGRSDPSREWSAPPPVQPLAAPGTARTSRPAAGAAPPRRMTSAHPRSGRGTRAAVRRAPSHPRCVARRDRSIHAIAQRGIRQRVGPFVTHEFHDPDAVAPSETCGHRGAGERVGRLGLDRDRSARENRWSIDTATPMRLLSVRMQERGPAVARRTGRRASTRAQGGHHPFVGMHLGQRFVRHDLRQHREVHRRRRR